MLSKSQSYAFKAEKLVANHLISKGNKVDLATSTDLQFKDIDLIGKCPQGRDFTVSVKFMPVVNKTGNYGFENKQFSSKTGETKDGWFNYGKSTHTVICVPQGEDQMELAIWETRKLKEWVLETYHAKKNLTTNQKSFNVGRYMDNTEMLLVKREILRKYAQIAIVQLIN